MGLTAGLFLVVGVALGAPIDGKAHAVLSASTGWTPDRTEDAVELSSKPVPGTGLTAWRGVVELAPGVDADAMLAVISNTSRHTEVSADLLESVAVRQEHGANLYYQVLDLPAPISDRFWICYSQTTRDHGSPGSHLRRWSSVGSSAAADVRAQIVAKHGRAVEVEYTHGQWLLEPQANGRLKVTLRSVVDPGGSIPAGVAGTIAGRGVAENIRRMEAAARAREAP